MKRSILISINCSVLSLANTSKVDVSLWGKNQDYYPGDLVFADIAGQESGTIYRCKQIPMADFCAEFEPNENIAGAWELYDDTETAS